MERTQFSTVPRADVRLKSKLFIEQFIFECSHLWGFFFRETSIQDILSVYLRCEKKYNHFR